MSLYDEVIEIANQLPLDEYGKTYLHAMNRIPPTNDEAIRVQALYIANNSHPKTDREKEAWQQLLKIGRVSDETVKEALVERLSSSFESYTEGKVRNIPDEEDIWELEDSDVLKCSGRKDELDMGGACYVMGKFEAKAFERLKPEIQQKVSKLAKEHIIFNSLGVFAKYPNTQHPGEFGYSYAAEVDEYCRQLAHDKGGDLPDVIACEIESTITGEINGKPYIESRWGDKEWRVDAVRKDIEKENYLFKTDVLSDEERDTEVKRLEKERENHKVDFNDFKQFSEEYNYPLEMVLKANPWNEDVLADDAVIAIEKLDR